MFRFKVSNKKQTNIFHRAAADRHQASHSIPFLHRKLFLIQPAVSEWPLQCFISETSQIQNTSVYIRYLQKYIYIYINFTKIYKTITHAGKRLANFAVYFCFFSRVDSVPNVDKQSEVFSGRVDQISEYFTNLVCSKPKYNTQ